MVAWRVAVALQVVGATPLLVVGASRGRTAVGQLDPVASRVVSVGDVPVRVLAFIANRVDLGPRAVEKTNRVAVPVVELDPRPGSVEDDVGSRLEDRIPADAAGWGAAVGDVVEPPAADVYCLGGGVVQFEVLVAVDSYRAVAVPVGAAIVLVVRGHQYLVDVDRVSGRRLGRSHCQGPQTGHQHQQDCGHNGSAHGPATRRFSP